MPKKLGAQAVMVIRWRQYRFDRHLFRRNLNELMAATPNEIQRDYSRCQAQQLPTDDRSKVCGHGAGC